MIANIILVAAITVRRVPLVDVVCLALPRLHSHVIRLGEIHVPDVGTVLLEFTDGPLKVAVASDQLAHCVVGLVLRVLSVRGLRGEQLRVRKSLPKFASVVGAGCRPLVRNQICADANAGVIIDGPLELQQRLVQFLEVVKIRHERVVNEANQLRLLIVDRQQLQCELLLNLSRGCIYLYLELQLLVVEIGFLDGDLLGLGSSGPRLLDRLHRVNPALVLRDDDLLLLCAACLCRVGGHALVLVRVL